MPSLIPITSLTDPALADLLRPYRNQKDAWLRAQRTGGTGLDDGLFLAEGELVVRTLIDSAHETVSVLCSPTRHEGMNADLSRLPDSTPILVAERPIIEQITGIDLHRGILALGRRSDPPSAEQLMETSRTLVICEDLANHDNVGAIFRNSAALAPHAAVLLSPRCCDPLYRKSLRVSMGHALRVPFATLEPWPEGLDRVAAAGFETVALTPAPDATSIRELSVAPGHRLALIVGAEGPGLTTSALDKSMHRALIPIAPDVDSLNVSTALAIALAQLAPA